MLMTILAVILWPIYSKKKIVCSYSVLLVLILMKIKLSHILKCNTGLDIQ